MGRTLTAVPGTWSPAANLRYRWYANGVSIAGATAPTYTVPSAAAGKRITVKVAASRSGYAETKRTSAAVVIAD